MPASFKLYDSEGNLVGPENPLEIAIPSGSKVGVSTIDMPTTLRFGRVLIQTGGTEVRLSETSVALLNGVTVKAAIANTQTVYVGDATVASGNGFELSAGQEIFLVIDNLNRVYVDIANGQSNQSVTFIGS